MELENNAIVAIGLFINLLRLRQKRRKLLRRSVMERLSRNAVHQRGLYCLHGYSSGIFKAVMDKNNTVVKQHLRLSISALEEVVRYSEAFLSKKRGWLGVFYVTVFLYWLGCGASYRVTAASFSISRYTVRDIVHKCLKGFLQLMPSVIKYPNEDEFEEISLRLNRRAGTFIFTNAVGAIDGSHIRIAVPIRLRDQYMNRKSFTSIQLQAVCSSNMAFTSIFCGFPGSVYDERVLKNSELFKQHSFPPAGFYLLGDSGYKCRSNPIAIITPYKQSQSQPLTARKRKFNELHSKARSIIESALGLLKLRWRSIFDKPLRLKIGRCIETVAVACIMHNICLHDGFESVTPVEDFAVYCEHRNGIEDDAVAEAIRDEIANNILL